MAMEGLQSFFNSLDASVKYTIKLLVPWPVVYSLSSPENGIVLFASMVLHAYLWEYGVPLPPEDEVVRKILKFKTALFSPVEQQVDPGPTRETQSPGLNEHLPTRLPPPEFSCPGRKGAEDSDDCDTDIPLTATSAAPQRVTSEQIGEGPRGKSNVQQRMSVGSQIQTNSNEESANEDIDPSSMSGPIPVQASHDQCDTKSPLTFGATESYSFPERRRSHFDFKREPVKVIHRQDFPLYCGDGPVDDDPPIQETNDETAGWTASSPNNPWEEPSHRFQSSILTNPPAHVTQTDMIMGRNQYQSGIDPGRSSQEHSPVQETVQSSTPVTHIPAHVNNHTTRHPTIGHENSDSNQESPGVRSWNSPQDARRQFNNEHVGFGRSHQRQIMANHGALSTAHDSQQETATVSM